MDGIIGYDYWMVFFHPNMGSVVDHSSQGRSFLLLFHPNLESVVDHSSQGRFFLLLLRNFLKNDHVWSNKMISGPDNLKSDDILLDFIIFRVPSFRAP